MPHSKENNQNSVAFYTLGCKTNQLESSTMADEFKSHGWDVVPFDEPAELYVVNTCTVTERGDNESKRVIRRAHLSNPEARIAVTGCYAQVSPDEVAGLDGVSYVIGNNFKDDVYQIVTNTPVNLSSEPTYVQVSDIDKSRIMEGASQASIDRTRGSLKIQDGCDYKCTYCIIWEARGLSRSLPLEDIKTHLKRMVFEGFKEIGLTGINIGQYICPDTGADLSDLLKALCTLDGDFRIRLTSLDPLEVPDKLVDTMADSEGKICPHFHLSAQSAEDTVLKRMARRHHVKDMMHVCAYIRERMPHASIGSDIIVGFPGETAERYETTYANLEACGMNYFHVFSYSKRKGTPAADYPDQVPDPQKKQRAGKLRNLAEHLSMSYREQFIGQTLTVIVEDSGLKGMSENYIPVILDTDTPLQPNTRVDVSIASVTNDDTTGHVIKAYEDKPALTVIS